MVLTAFKYICHIYFYMLLIHTTYLKLLIIENDFVYIIYIIYIFFFFFFLNNNIYLIFNLIFKNFSSNNRPL